MRSKPMSRIAIGAAALTLLASSAIHAQTSLEPPPDIPGLTTVVITSALDDSRTNRLIEDTALAFHLDAGGVASNKKGNGWLPQAPQPSTEAITETLLEVAKEQPTIVVISGGDAQADVGVARSAERTQLIDLGQAGPCVTEDGKPDPSGTCAGGEGAIPSNYMAVDFAVEDGAYLAGLLAAAASRNERIGIVSGAADCVECNRYIRGFVNGARSLKPEIAIELAYLADSETAAFSDADSAKTFTQAFIEIYQPDVLLPLGRGVSTAMIEAACEAGDVLAVGTGIDVAAANPDLAECVLTSVTKDLGGAVYQAMYDYAQYAFARGGALQRLVRYDLEDDHVAVIWPRQSLPVDTAERYQAAQTGILTGQIDTCGEDCGKPLSLDGGLATPVPAATDSAG